LPPSKKLHHGSWASVVSGPAGSVVVADDVVLQTSLASQLEPLQRCLEQVASFLERAEAALSKLSLLPTVLSPIGEVGVGSVEDIGVELYGCLSPRVGGISSVLSALPLVPSATEGEDIDDVVASVLQVMSDLHELCASPSLRLVSRWIRR
jgi:hypothetical protein